MRRWLNGYWSYGGKRLHGVRLWVELRRARLRHLKSLRTGRRVWDV